MKALQWLCMFEGVGNNQITDLIKRVQTDSIGLSSQLQSNSSTTSADQRNHIGQMWGKVLTL